MNDPTESTPRAQASVERINGHAADTGLVYSRHNVGRAEMFQHGTRELADYLQLWPLPVRAEQLGTENGPHGGFMTVFSHELRNSLGAIRSATHILRMETSVGPTAVKARALIERQVGQMTRLVEDLLDVSRLRSGHLRLQRERIDLCAVAAHAAQTVEFAMQQRNHRMTTAFPEAPVWLHADPTRLEQVFVNLLFNAAKYTEAGGEVELSVVREEDEATVHIRDTGIGIAPDVLPHVFDLFAQANPSSQRADAGLGIGLALVRSLVECHGGRVTAASAGLGHGSEFTVRLPCLQSSCVSVGRPPINVVGLTSCAPRATDSGLPIEFLPMRLSDFIRTHSDEIAKEWEAFARTCSPAAAKMNVDQLRDHILPLLRFVADDMDAPQTDFEQSEKAQGRLPLAKVEASEAEKHAALRIIDGFTVDQVVGEFRALRASILRLWIKRRSADIQADPTQITRFNESIDQMLSESVGRHGHLESQAREHSTGRDAFLATLSHELRGPLAAIVNGVNIVKASGATNASLSPVAAMMSRQSQHLRRLLDDLLDLARISRNRLSISCVPTDIRQCVQDAVDANCEGLTQGAYILKLDIPEAPLVGEVDCTRVVQVISILLNNAVKYSPAGSRIDVSLTRENEYALFSVRDEGIGIAAEMLPRIFDAFYVTNENNLAKHGLGIGLWLARRLVELHAGTISAKSEGPTRGAEFCAAIPLAISVAARGAS